MDKVMIYQSTLEALNNKINDLRLILQESYPSMFDDSKSSAGDKHETALAMAQLEQEKLTKQLNILLLQEASMKVIDPSLKHQKITIGSLVETDKGWYYFSISLGQLICQNNAFFALSLEAPLGQIMRGKVAGEQVIFNGMITEIIGVI
jgi:transcription elongation GreA/GreB family factor